MKNSLAFWVGVLLLSFSLLSNTFFTVDKREKAVLFAFGEIKTSDFSPGIHFKLPFVETVQKFDARRLMLDSPTENFLTSEKKNVEVDFFAQWRIADVVAYYRATGGQELVAQDRLAAIVNPALRAEFGSRTIQQAVAGERDEMVAKLMAGVKDKVKELGIELMDVRIKTINLPRSVSGSAYDRMKAERTRTASDLRARGAEEAERIRSEADRKVQVELASAYRDAEKLRGEGDAKAAEIYSKAYGIDPEFYSFYRSLNLYRESFSSKQDVLVLEPDGPLFRHFNSTP